jgi:hypothetical protein
VADTEDEVLAEFTKPGFDAAHRIGQDGGQDGQGRA